MHWDLNLYQKNKKVKSKHRKIFIKSDMTIKLPMHYRKNYWYNILPESIINHSIVFVFINCVFIIIHLYD